MKLGMTLDEVLRATLKSLKTVFDKYEIGEAPEFDTITNEDYLRDFKITNETGETNDLGTLLYSTAALEIFGLAIEIDKMLNKEYLHEYLYDFLSEPENTFTLILKEKDRSIPATLFFLSKIGLQVNAIKNYEDFDNIWDEYDAIITANPKILTSKPENKTTIKINSPYNTNIQADESYNYLHESFAGEFLSKYN